MKISERLSDYGLIGGFFWMLQAIIIWLTVLSDDASWTSDLEQLRVTVNNFPNAAFSVLVALFGTAGLISVFATGLVLDLLSSSFFRTIEMYIFVKHARRHRHWFQRVADANSAYIQEDLTVLLTHPSLKHFLNTSGLKIWTKRT